MLELRTRAQVRQKITITNDKGRFTVDLVNDYECNCGTGCRQVVRHEDDLKTCLGSACGSQSSARPVP